MKTLFKKYNIELEKEELEKFEKFLEIFKQKNSQINLSAIREDQDIIEKHFIDSIMLNTFLDFEEIRPSSSGPKPASPHPSPLPRGEGTKGIFSKDCPTSLPLGENEGGPAGLGGGLEDEKRELEGEQKNGEVREIEGRPNNSIKLADLGTGGGFPLIPLAIVNPNLNFVGIDSVAKKLKAVEDFVQKLNLKNVQTLVGRAEEIGQNPDYRGSFNFVTSRATAYFPTLLEYAIPLLKVGGIFIAYKLDDKQELKSAKKALKRLSSKILKVKNYSIAGQKRTLVFIEKLQPTHKKYPRKVGIPLKSPIK